jgi:hypothetical protein
VTIELVVNGLTFDFDDRWVALKWDDHAAWRDGLNGHRDTKAIDILALRDEDELWLIEAGDARGDARRISHKNKRTALSEPIEIEFANKVRDTIAASAWAQGRVRAASQIVRYLRAACRGAKGRVHTVLWQEGVKPDEAEPIADAARRRLNWLHPTVRVANTAIVAKVPTAAIAGLSVRTTKRRS